MIARYLAFGSIGMLLAGCAAAPDSTADTANAPVGYRFYDANHPNTVTAASPQAIYNATHGVWLWGPSINDSMRRGG
ncbi:MAG TPA: hypothetical protein VKI44_35415 [Acetobacteraceae bacterium]|nr:hypothetical protein [Acetobacteraceae bacterium]